LTQQHTEIIPKKIQFHSFETNALHIRSHKPALGKKNNAVGLFTHGYTAHKGQLFNWALRLSDFGSDSIIFDLPGHYLGSFNEVKSFEDFKNYAHHLFYEAFKLCDADQDSKVILGGHSLGALLALMALDLDEFAPYEKMAIGVGVGISKEGHDHPLETPFFEKTMDIRSQIVSPSLNPKNIFSWIKEIDSFLNVSHERIHLITGQDDGIISEHMTKRLADKLLDFNNNVTVEFPRRIPHHLPELASVHISKILRDEHFFDD
jgi:hypothetical protein